MPGPPPNPDARRRNSSGEWTLISGRRELLPDLPDIRGWLPQTVEAWETWWASPMATQWDDADLPTVILAAVAYDGALIGERGAAAEFRQLADRLGLHSLGRQRNRWKVADDAAADARASDATVTKLRVV